MPSIVARLTKLYIGYKFSAVRNATPELSYETIFTQAESEDKVDPLPSDISGNDQFKLEERREKLPAGQEWVVHHLSLNEGYQGEQRRIGKEQVLVYWHGGAFRNKATPHHWQFIKTIMLATGLPAIVPHYTKSPLATSSQSVLGALSLLLSISKDPAYKDKEIVMMGDSAGGWFVLRLILAMTELALGDFKQAGAELFDREECKAARRKMRKGIAISGCFELDLARTTFKEDELLQSADPWLSQVALRPTIPLWTYGPHAVTPSAASRLPANCPALSHPEYIPSEGEVQITDPMFAPTTGVHVLQRYVEREKPEKTLRIVMSIGTADILYNQNTRMYEALKGLRQGVVRPTLITEEGLFHVYPLIQYMYESQQAIKQFVDLINDE